MPLETRIEKEGVPVRSSSVCQGQFDNLDLSISEIDIFTTFNFCKKCMSGDPVIVKYWYFMYDYQSTARGLRYTVELWYHYVQTCAQQEGSVLAGKVLTYCTFNIPLRLSKCVICKKLPTFKGSPKKIGGSITAHCRQLSIRGRASILLSEGCGFESPGLHVEVSLGRILNPNLLLMCSLTPCMAATTISVWMYELL